MQLSDFGVSFAHTTLNDGTPLAVFNKKSAPISLRVTFLSGARFDPFGKEGLAHFTEHLICSGNQKWPNKEDIGQFVESKGAYFNAHTNADFMEIVFDYAQTTDTSEILDFIYHQLNTSTFNQDTIETERGAIQAELQRALSDPNRILYDLHQRLVYQGSPISTNTLGSEPSINSITREDLQNCYLQTFSSGRCVITAAGDIGIDDLTEKLNNLNLIRPAGTKLPASSTHFQHDQGRGVEFLPGKDQVRLYVSFPGVDMFHADLPALRLLSRCLGGSRTSQLYRVLRLENGLVYGVGMTCRCFWGTGDIRLWTDCRKADLPKVLSLIGQALKYPDLTQEGLDKRRQAVIKSSLLNMQTSADWTSAHSLEFLFNPSHLRTVVDDLHALENVTLAQVKNVAQRYLDFSKVYVAACGEVTETDLVFD